MRHTLLLVGLALAACSPPSGSGQASAPAEPARISEAEAIAFINQVPTALVAHDVEGAVARFADDAVLVDVAANDLVTTREANIAATNEFLNSGVTSFAINSQRAQILDADTFVVTSIVTARMTHGREQSEATFRLTDVAQKQPDGGWLIVNEHGSAAPQPLAQPLPVTSVIPAN